MGTLGDSYVIFSPEQVKNVDNLNPTSSADIHFSVKDKISDYSKKEYNRYGWAVANRLLSREEMAVFQKQVGDKARGDLYKVREGLHIIPTGENGLRNVLVYTDGNFERPSIARIIRMNLDDGTEIEYITEAIYYAEQQTVDDLISLYEKEGILSTFRTGDYDYAEWKRRRKARSNRTVFEDRAGEQDGRGSDRESQADSKEIKYSLPDDYEVLDYIEMNEEEFYDLPPMRDYEVKQTFSEWFTGDFYICFSI